MVRSEKFGNDRDTKGWETWDKLSEKGLAHGVGNDYDAKQRT